MSADKNTSQPEILPFDQVIEMPLRDALKYLRSIDAKLTKYYSEDEAAAIERKLFDFMYDEEDGLGLSTVFDESSRNSVWLSNHYLIMQSIVNKLRYNGWMPSVSEISRETKLSRVTVTKHLKHFEKEEFLNTHRQRWKLAAEKVLMRLHDAVYHSTDEKTRLKAMDLFLKHSDRLLNPIRERQQSNTFIQINHIFVNQETIKSLPEDKRKAIEDLILSANANLS